MHNQTPAQIVIVPALLLLTLIPLSAGRYRSVVDANRGHILIVAFWATWCEPCRQELPRLRNLVRQSHGHTKLVTISADEPEALASADRFLSSLKIRGRNYALAPDSAAPVAQVIPSVDPEWTGALPAIFVYNATGALQAKYWSEVDWRALEQLVKSAR